MIDDLIDNNRYYCFLNSVCNCKDVYELLVAEYVYAFHNYYTIYYDNYDKSFRFDGNRKIEKANIYSKIVGAFTGFHKYDKNKKYKNGYYLAILASHFISIIKIINNETYKIEFIMDTLVIYPEELLGPYCISDNTFYLVDRSVEEI